jgi:hypothetical protein
MPIAAATTRIPEMTKTAAIDHPSEVRLRRLTKWRIGS